ncbi:hypothetical protein PS15m_007958 [Mucor circinelloides]
MSLTCGPYFLNTNGSIILKSSGEPHVHYGDFSSSKIKVSYEGDLYSRYRAPVESLVPDATAVNGSAK